MARTQQNRGMSAFRAHYEAIYGEAWEVIGEALLRDPAYLRLGDVQPYFLDAASYLCARTLDVGNEHRVLDMCAAPGGKTLVLAGMRPSGIPDTEVGTFTLTANDLSRARRTRLKRVVEAHLAASIQPLVRVTGFDASRWGLHEPQAYDRILCDVPCSSERHVIGSESDLAKWKASRPKQLAQRQYAILCAGIDALRPQGRLVYSTCALDPKENDGVVRKALARRAGLVQPGATASRVRQLAEEHGLPPPIETECGVMYRPDLHAGMGPMYISLLEKPDL